MVPDLPNDSPLAVNPSSPLLFISHRHADKPIAEVLRQFTTERSLGRISVYQSSSAEAQGPGVGKELKKELKEALWAAGVVILVFTSPEEDWSYCMWECGVATHPASPDTKVIVLQCTPQPPSVYTDAVRIVARDLTAVTRFVSDFLTSSDLFPNFREPLAPGWDPNGEEVRKAADWLHRELEKVIPGDPQEGDDWATLPFLRLLLTYAEVDRIRELKAAEGARIVYDAARVGEIDPRAMHLFGLGKVDFLSPFRRLVDVWQERWPNESRQWIDELAEQIRVGSHWQVPIFQWQLMRSADDADHARYAPFLSRVRSVPRDRVHHFDIYFSKFETDDHGAIRLGFAHDPQAPPPPLPEVVDSAP